VEVVKYSDLVKRVCALAQRVYSELSNDDNDLIGIYLDQRLKLIWEYYDWPELKRAEKRYYRPLYATATTYSAGLEVYYPTEKKYYQALKATNGNAPTSTSHWAESKQSYSGDSWVSGTTYAVGDTVLYAVDGNYYACHTAHTASGTLTPDGAGGNDRWGKLTELDQYVAWEQTGENKIGDIIEVWDQNPRTNNKAEPETYFQSENGIQVLNGPNFVFVEYRQRLPHLLYTAWATGSDYGENDVVRFPATGADFDLYKATGDHTPSNSNKPEETGAPWSLIQIPRDFSAYLSHGAASNLLQVDEKETLALAQEQYAEQALSELLDRVERQEQQQRQMKVLQR
tara:strand:- start:4888 stop:5913 length:1026 start_codon:yes stop_codon:yes gene_type:complete